MKFFNKNLQVQKLSLSLHPTNIHIILGQKINNYFLNRINGKPTMMAAWKLSAVLYAQRMYVSHIYGGLLLFITILTTMTTVMNYFDYAIWNEAGLTDFQFLTLMEKGGEV